jgi:carbamoyltransferase
MKILGISCFYHDSSSAIISNGVITAASQEERFTRVKNDSSFPTNSILNNLKITNTNSSDIDAVVFYEKPFVKFERILETYLAFSPMGFSSFRKAIPLWIEKKIFQKKFISDELLKLGFREDVCKKLYFSEHHLSHAASAFYPSPFSEAIVLTMDGVGEWASTSVYIGKDNTLKKMREIHFPHSLGLLYSAFTYHCGFKVNSGEYKLMGLAPYGKAIFKDVIKKELIDIKDDGSFRLNLKYFNYCTGHTMTSERFNRLFHESFRLPEEKIEQIHMDLAASVQSVLEEVVLKLCRSLKDEFRIENLCLAGGVALNCVANGKIYDEKIFKDIWIQPSAGDAGCSLGAALELYYGHFKKPRNILPKDSMNGSYLGPSFTNEEIESILIELGAVYQFCEDSELFEITAQELSTAKSIGWFQGRMEFGPRSLGNRSILADPRGLSVQKDLNLKIKFRESFRPFAPAVIEEDALTYFDFNNPSPYMLMVAQVRKNFNLPAITHIDGSARLQTVSDETNERFYKLLTAFKEKTNCSVVVNTSFNIRGEPIVCTPKDAYRCFMGTNLDVLVLNNFLLKKEKQPAHLINNYSNKFELD